MKPAPGLTKQAAAWRGTPSNYSLYAPVPHQAALVTDLFTPTEEKVWYWLQKRPHAHQLKTKAWVCGQHSYADIARATQIHWTTARRAILALRAKQSIDTREVWANDARGGRRVGTLYSIPAYDDILQRRRELPGVVVTPRGAVVYIGRARRPMTLDEAAAWALNLEAMPGARDKAPAAASVTHARVARSAQVAEMPAAVPVLDEAAVLDALTEYCPAELKDARDVIAAARKAAPAVTLEVVVDELHHIYRRKDALDRKRNAKDPVITPGWFLSRIGPHVDKWRRDEVKREAERERAARIERDARINFYAETLAQLDTGPPGSSPGEPLTEDERERENERRAYLDAADPAELEMARAVLAHQKARTA